jgi:putative DNA primase/helicase
VVRLFAIPRRADLRKQLLKRITDGKLFDGDGVAMQSFTPRQVAVKHWSGLSSPDAVRKAADLLVEFGWLEKETVPSSDAMGRGRPSERYWIHPLLLKKSDREVAGKAQN